MRECSFSVRYIEGVTKSTQWHCNETTTINKLSITRFDFDFQQLSTISQNFRVFPICNQIRQYKMGIIITTVVCNEYRPLIDRVIKSPLTKFVKRILTTQSTKCMNWQVIITRSIVWTFITYTHSNTIINFVDGSLCFSVNRVLSTLKVVEIIFPRNGSLFHLNKTLVIWFDRF